MHRRRRNPNLWGSKHQDKEDKETDSDVDDGKSFNEQPIEQKFKYEFRDDHRLKSD